MRNKCCLVVLLLCIGTLACHSRWEPTSMDKLGLRNANGHINLVAPKSKYIFEFQNAYLDDSGKPFGSFRFRHEFSEPIWIAGFGFGKELNFNHPDNGIFQAHPITYECNKGKIPIEVGHPNPSWSDVHFSPIQPSREYEFVISLRDFRWAKSTRGFILLSGSFVTGEQVIGGDHFNVDIFSSNFDIGNLDLDKEIKNHRETQ